MLNELNLIQAKGKWSPLKFESKGDKRGELVALQGNIEIPFSIKRVYYMTKNSDDIVRGLHAHRNLEQVLIAVSGSVTVTVDDGFKKETFQLDSHLNGLWIKDLVWREIFNFSNDCVLLALASELYDPADYIHDYELFKTLARSN